MTTLTTARDAGFEAALVGRPEDAGLRLVYADWLDDRGEHAYAAAHRWLAKVERWPVRCEISKRKVWFVFGHDGHSVKKQPKSKWFPALLPAAAFDRLGVGLDYFVTPQSARQDRLEPWASGGWLYYRDPQQAVEYLAKALDGTNEG